MGQIDREQRLGGNDRTGGCEHVHTVTTFIAGLARSVCESCGNVSIRYLGEAAHWPEDSSVVADIELDNDRVVAKPKPTPACKRCREEAYFITPWGLACTDHAWEAASRQDPLSGEFWIPLLIDRTDTTA